MVEAFPNNTHEGSGEGVPLEVLSDLTEASAKARQGAIEADSLILRSSIPDFARSDARQPRQNFAHYTFGRFPPPPGFILPKDY